MAQHIKVARQRGFVGRETETAQFKTMLEPGSPFVLLHVHGPGGVGKTSLLHEWLRVAREMRVPATYLNGRDIEPSPEGFLSALERASGPEAHGSPLAPFLSDERRLLLIDTFEAITPLDPWLRETLLPQLSDATRVVLAGRQSPSEPWHTDAGWHAIMQTVSLRNLAPVESRTYLEAREIPQDQHPAILDFTHGHPLALTLIADAIAQQSERIRPEATPNLIRTLLERFIQSVPSPTHREALEVCALVRTTTEALLNAVLATDDARACFEWLRDLSFIEAGPEGLYPHDLARDALDADLRWRNPDRYAELHARVRAYYTRKLQETTGLEQQRVLFEDVYLHRHSPMVKPFLEWGQVGTVYGERATPADIPHLLAMAEAHEGKEAAERLAFWLERQPRSVTVYRDAQPLPAGFLMSLNLRVATQSDLDRDPATKAAWAYASRHAPARLEENVLFFRFWMARDLYQGVSATQSVIFLSVAQTYLTCPKLAWTFFPCADPAFWLPALHYMDIRRTPEADFQVGARTYSVFAHDWRAVPTGAWLELLGQRELKLELKPEDLEASRAEPLLVLSEPEFFSSVRDALRNYHRPRELAANPLLRSRLVRERAGDDPVPTLQHLLREAAEQLARTPKGTKSYRSVLRTYLEPAATQELAAEMLGLPFSTYRRHLNRGLDKIAAWLWQCELHGGSFGDRLSAG